MQFRQWFPSLAALLFCAATANAQQPAQPKKPPVAADPDAGDKPPAAKPPAAKPPAAKPPAAKPPAAKPPAGAPPGAKPPAAKPGQAAPGAGEAEGEAEEAGAEGEAAGEGEEEEEVPEPPPTRVQPGQTPPPTSPGTGTGFGPMPMWPQPGTDARELQKQGADRPEQKQKDTDDERVYAEDWWSHARPILELHGYFRLRAELFHNFSLGRVSSPIWPLPADNRYAGYRGTSLGTYGPALCTPDESTDIQTDDDNPTNARFPCKNKTQAGANIRFRLNPELHISDNLRVISQIDLLDNLVLGSTPEGYANAPYGDGGHQVVQRGGYTPLGAFETTQVPPSAGRNSFNDSVQVKRAWAEYLTPVGQLRFGRMPSHWGLGILANSGDKYDDDYQTTADRIMFITGIKSLDLYFGAAWDFANEGPTSASYALPQGQPYDLAQLDDVDQYVFVIMRRKNPDLTKLALAQGNLVLNGGLYVVHRRQLLANDTTEGCNNGAAALGCTSGEVQDGYTRRGASAWIPDLWLQLLYKKFRFEIEAVTIQGSIENTLSSPGGGNYTQAPGGEGWKIRQWGIAGEIEQKLVEDRLRLGFWSGWASGDAEADTGGSTNELNPGTGFQPQIGDETISTFRFHPTYKVDLILWRNLLNRIQGAYYFRPSVEYDFVREGNGQRFGGGFAAIWSRASEFTQTPGHKRDLGVELNLSLYFQSKDGALNDDPDKMGGFFTMLQYGVLFPMGGLGYQSEESQDLEQDVGPGASETSTAQILRWYLGVFF